jgi:hypothetical protein
MPGLTKFIPAQVTASETDDGISFRVASGSNSVVAFGDGPFAQSAAAVLVAPSRCVGARLLLSRRCPKQLPTTSRWDLLTAPLVFRLNATVNKLFRCCCFAFAPVAHLLNHYSWDWRSNDVLASLSVRMQCWCQTQTHISFKFVLSR